MGLRGVDLSELDLPKARTGSTLAPFWSGLFRMHGKGVRQCCSRFCGFGFGCWARCCWCWPSWRAWRRALTRSSLSAKRQQRRGRAPNLDRAERPPRAWSLASLGGHTGVACQRQGAYWTSLFGATIGRANLDGTAGTTRPSSEPGALRSASALTTAMLYWSSGHGLIGRANLDGTDVDHHFITGVPFSHQLAFDGRRHSTGLTEIEADRPGQPGRHRRPATLYHHRCPGRSRGERPAQLFEPQPRAELNTIGRADPSRRHPCRSGTHRRWRCTHLLGVAVDSRHIYWTWNFLGIVSRIARANLDGTHVDPDFITDAGSYVQGLAVPSSAGRVDLLACRRRAVPGRSACRDPLQLPCDIGGPALRSCMDSNGSSAPSGHLATGTPAAHHYTATATDEYGQTGTASIAYTVVVALSVQITTPAPGSSYVHGQVVSTSFVCHDGIGGPGIKSCRDEKGSTSSPGVLDTSTLGPHTYTVTATSQDGQITTKSADDQVKPPGPPSVQVTTPASGSVWSRVTW